MKIRWIAVALIIIAGFSIGTDHARAAQKNFSGRIDKIRMSWEPMKNAVKYQLVITEGKTDEKDDIVTEKKQIYTNGYEWDTRIAPICSKNFYWKVRPLDFDGRPIGDFSKPKPVLEEEINPQKPLLTSQSEHLPYAKIYPVYSWVPVAQAQKYEVQVFKAWEMAGREELRLLKTILVNGPKAFDYYDNDGYIAAGTYYWRVRALNLMGRPLGEWSEKKPFTIRHGNVKIAALGDSITHGGGAVSAPPSYVLYDWETYADVPILNLGFSGDTVEAMNGRFAKDVPPFSPQVLIVMGGVNNLRLGDSAKQVIRGLNQLKYKCLFKGIEPVFVTVTPIDPDKMRRVSKIAAAPNWLYEQRKVNEWIRRQKHFVDVAPLLADQNGLMKAELSTDGLHPDVEGKRLIGAAVGDYLRKRFPDAAFSAKKS